MSAALHLVLHLLLSPSPLINAANIRKWLKNKEILIDIPDIQLKIK